MSSLKNTLFTGWSLQRWVRMLMGLILIVLYFAERDALVLFAGTLISLQALLNTGCCGSSCGPRYRTTPGKQENKEIIYEEIG